MLVSNIFRRVSWYSKVVKSRNEAIKGMKDGNFVMVGGFGICGTPMNLIQAVREMGVKDLTVASNNCGVGDKTGQKDWGLGVLLRQRQIKRIIASYVGENVEFQRQYLTGELELQICPQGTLAEKVRSGGAGIPAFYTATGAGTVVQNGGFPIKFKPGTAEPEILSKPRQVKVFNGRRFVMEETLFADYALVKAQKADQSGNLVFNKTARNFNADMCRAAHCVVAQVEQIVPNGSIDPNHVQVPGIFVNRIFKSDPNDKYSEKKIEKLTVQKNQSQQNSISDDDIRMKIIRRASKEVKDGMNVNLGIGIPTLLPSVLPKKIEINLQSQNGMFGVGSYPLKGKQDPDLINAGKETVTINNGGSYFSSSDSFGIIRGGHLDLTMLGALQISQRGDIANWIIPGKMVKGMGGAMDLVASGSRVIVVMEHTAKKSLKILEECTLPLTAKRVVSMLITELAVFQDRGDGLVLIEIAEGTTLEHVQSVTGFKLQVAEPLGRF